MEEQLQMEVGGKETEEISNRIEGAFASEGVE